MWKAILPASATPTRNHIVLKTSLNHCVIVVFRVWYCSFHLYCDLLLLSHLISEVVLKCLLSLPVWYSRYSARKTRVHSSHNHKDKAINGWGKEKSHPALRETKCSIFFLLSICSFPFFCTSPEEPAMTSCPYTPKPRSFSDGKKPLPPFSQKAVELYFFHAFVLIHLSFHNQPSFLWVAQSAFVAMITVSAESKGFMAGSCPAPAPAVWCQHISWLPACNDWLSSSSLSSPFGCSESGSLLWGTGKASGRSTGSVSLGMNMWKYSSKCDD